MSARALAESFTRRAHVALGCAAFGIGLSSWVVPANAARLQRYAAPAACPDASWFEHELSQEQVAPFERSHVSVLVEVKTEVDGDPTAQPQFKAQLAYTAKAKRSEQAAPPLEGSSEPADPAAQSGWQRELSGPNCEELLSVLAVSLAVYLESRADEPDAYPLLPDEPLPPEVAPAWYDPPKLDYVASAKWRLGFVAGLGLRTGLTPGATGNWTVGLDLRGVRAGWGAGPFELGFGQLIGPNRSSAPNGENLEQHYWAVHVLACPWMSAPDPALRVGPAIGFYGGRFGARVPRVPELNSDSEVWFSFTELVLLGELHRSSVVARIQLGLQFPISPYRVALEGQQVYQQSLGLVMGLSLGWSGVLL